MRKIMTKEPGTSPNHRLALILWIGVCIILAGLCIYLYQDTLEIVEPHGVFYQRVTTGGSVELTEISTAIRVAQPVRWLWLLSLFISLCLYVVFPILLFTRTSKYAKETQKSGMDQENTNPVSNTTGQQILSAIRWNSLLLAGLCATLLPFILSGSYSDAILRTRQYMEPLGSYLVPLEIVKWAVVMRLLLSMYFFEIGLLAIAVGALLPQLIRGWSKANQMSVGLLAVGIILGVASGYLIAWISDPFPEIAFRRSTVLFSKIIFLAIPPFVISVLILRVNAILRQKRLKTSQPEQLSG